MNNEEILKIDPVEVYKLRLSGKIKTFPYLYFDKFANGDIAITRATSITKFMIEEIMKLKTEDIPKKLNAFSFTKYCLKTMLKGAFSNDVFEAVESVYPNRFSRFEFIRSKNKISPKVAKDAMKWFVEEKLKLDLEKAGKRLSPALFKEYNLNWLLSYYNGEIYDAVNDTYPEKYKPWHFTCKKGYWTRETSKDAMKWLIEKKCNGIISNLTISLAEENNLSYAFSKFFSSDTFEVINAIYPNKYTRKDFYKFVMHTEEIRNLLSSIIVADEKYYLYKQINATFFKEKGLSKAIRYFNNDVYKAVSASFPEYSFKPWQFTCSKNFWNEKTAIELTKWLIEKEMHEKGIKNISEVSPKIYYKNGFGDLLNKIYNKDSYLAFKTAYPEIF